jgi:hypothetical protein
MRRRVESLIQVDLKHSFIGSGHSRDLVLHMIVEHCNLTINHQRWS